MENDVHSSFEWLVNNAKYASSTFNDSFYKPCGDVKIVDGISFGTFLPSPESYLMYDTTNKPDEFPEIAKKQMADYGAVGWYEYNIKYYGCKWNCTFETILLSDDGDMYEIRITVYTPNSPCETWVRRIKDACGFRYAFIHSVDLEGGCFGYYKETDGEEVDYSAAFIRLEEAYGDDDDTVYEEYDNLVCNQNLQFDKFVKNYGK